MFTEHEYLSPIRAFLMSYPGLKPDETLAIDYMAFDQFGNTIPPGQGAISIAGSNAVELYNDILGNVEVSVQDNYLFLLRRMTKENTLRRDAGDFLRNYVRWLNYENAVRYTEKRNPLLPKFSNFSNYDEVFTANGEMQMGLAEDGSDEYLIQIQIRYKLNYDEEEE